MSAKPTVQITRLSQKTIHLFENLDKLYRAFAEEEGHTSPPEQFTNFVRGKLDDDSMLLLLAMTDTEVIGYALVFDVIDHPFIPDWARTGYITQMFVQASHRNQEVGQRILNHSIEWLSTRGVPQVMLNVHAHNSLGEKFWRREGFTPHLIRMKRRIES